MIPLPKDIVAKDVSQWLEGCWFYAQKKDSDEKVLACMYNHAPSEKHESDVIGLVDGEKFRVPWKQMFAHWPLCGAVNVHPWAPQPDAFAAKFAVFLTRLQKKQWKRSFNASCVQARSIRDDHMQFSPEHKPIIWAAFNPVYYSYSQAVDELFKDGWESVAIDPHLVVQKGDKTRVFVDSELVGMIDKRNYFTCVNPRLKRNLLPSFDYRVE